VTSIEPVPATIILVRHGETDWNAEGRCQGTSDIPLNARGVEQIAQLARRLGAVHLDAAYTSPLGRARDTADRILAERDITATVVPELTELAYGERTGSVPAHWPHDLAQRWAQSPWDVEFEGGESLEMVRARAVPRWDRIVAEHSGRTVLVSAHGHLNRVLILHSTGRPFTDFWNLVQDNGDAVILRGSSAVSLTSYLTESSPEEINA
jgi:broad specificity phosphatase PhoE